MATRWFVSPPQTSKTSRPRVVGCGVAMFVGSFAEFLLRLTHLSLPSRSDDVELDQLQMKRLTYVVQTSSRVAAAVAAR